MDIVETFKAKIKQELLEQAEHKVIVKELRAELETSSNSNNLPFEEIESTHERFQSR